MRTFQHGLAAAERVQAPFEAEMSRTREVFNYAKRLLGRTALILGLAAGPGMMVGLGEMALDSKPAAASAANDYPDAGMVCVAGANKGKADGSGANWCPDYQFGYFTANGGNVQNSSRGYGYRNCTDWAAWRASELTGKDVPKNLGNAKDWNDNAPSSWNIDNTPEPGDIAESEGPAGDKYGHLGVVESEAKDSSGKITSIEVSQYNAGADGNYSDSTYTPDANGVFWRDTAKTKKWDNFLDLNGTGVGINGESTASGSNSSDNTVLRVIKENQSDDTNDVYWAKAGTVFESWWRPGGDGVHTDNLVDITQQDIKDIDVQMNPDGEHLIYTATTHNVWETWYYPGQGKHTATIVHDDANIRKIEKTVGPDGSQQLYVMVDGGVDEYWWTPGGEIHKNRIYTLANPVDMQKVTEPDGTQELYVADASYVYENWWRPGGAPHTGGQIMYIPQHDITDIDFSEDADGKHRIYAGREQSGVWEASWYPGGTGIQTWQVTGDNGVRHIEKYQDGNTQVLYVATAGGIFEYWWPNGTANVHGDVITAQADVHDFDRATTTDGAQAVYTAANTRVFESYWFPGGNGIHTSPIA